MRLPPYIVKNLRPPLISAPMFLVSGPELFIAACRSGIIGSFPTANCRILDDLDAWLGRIVGETRGAAPFAPNLIVHKSNTRLMDEAALVSNYLATMVIASVGSPALI
ncbi:MAG: nitronate monooxygenase, partial [Pseudomonadota bacterium]|nr:nitronate monooxygenase [Pseudomonadota bacterium]